ncbi:Reverse transcriptase from mobile element jockey protein [Ceratobasidium sp. AG-Ba]|nr:Reverse transcriptase from mobile element jockey protein [Ceratobasidium sp. AG-Ba]
MAPLLLLTNLVPSPTLSIYGHAIHITNAYFHGSNAKEGLALMLDTPAVLDSPAIYAGDFNLHHSLWALPEGVTPSQTGPADDLATWIITNDFMIMNSGARTRRGRKGQKDSVIDLTIANGKAWENDILIDWESSEQLSLDSDHNGISWAIKIPEDNEFTLAPKLYQYSIDASREEDWTEAFHADMNSRSIPHDITNEDACQHVAVSILEAMTKATHKTMPRTQVGNVARRCPWWDDACSMAVHNIVSYSQSDISDQDTWDALKGELRRCIRTARRSHADRVTAEVSQCTDLWKLRNWTSGKRYSKMPPIRSPNGYATDPQTQSKVFIDSFFPAVRPEVDLTVADCIPRRDPRQHHPITDSEITEALSTSSNTSAPGAFGSNYRVLKWAFKAKPAIFTSFFNACLTLGFHPCCLRNAIVSIIPKPRKTDMSNPSSYRPISLLETLSKCLEKIVTSRLLFDVGSHSLVPYSQFGSRDNSSCTDAGLAMVHDIQSFWQNSEKVSLLTLDIKGYFNNINHSLLIYILSRLGFSSPIVNWLRSFFSDRTVQIRIDSSISDPSPIASVGVPQGSPLSPILSAIYSLPLLLHMEHACNVEIKGYVDDFTILAHSGSFESNRDIIEESVHTASDILRRLGLSFEIEKCDLIHFAARPADMHTNLRVDLSPPGAYGRWVSPQPCIRWLGFYLDRRLSWKTHIKKRCSQALAVVASLRLLANSVRGISVKHGRLLFKTCVLPVLTYGSVIWYTGIRQKSLIKPMERVQNQGIRWLLGAFRTSPVSAMEHVASIPPLPLTLQRFSENAAVRLRRLHTQSQVARRLPPNWDTHSNDAPHPSRTKRSPPSIIYHVANMSQPDAEFTIPYLAAPWESPHPWLHRLKVTLPDPRGGREERNEYIAKAKNRISSAEEDGSLLCYSDGSKRITNGSRRVGAGFLIIRSGQEVSQGKLSLGPRADVFDAEMMALAISAKRAEYMVAHSHDPPKSILFSSDNQAAVRSISSLKPHNAQCASIIFRKAIDAILSNHPHIEITVQWIPGHSDFHGNTRADAIAKTAGLLTPTPVFNRTITWAKARSKEKVIQSWKKRWKSERHSAHVHVTLPKPPTWKLHPIHDRFRAPQAEMRGRELQSRLIQVILGHCFSGAYNLKHRSYNIDNIPDPTCPCDHYTVQTIKHVLRECPLHSDSRWLLRIGSPSIQMATLFGTLKGLWSIVDFLKDSGAFRFPRSVPT